LFDWATHGDVDDDDDDDDDRCPASTSNCVNRIDTRPTDLMTVRGPAYHTYVTSDGLHELYGYSLYVLTLSFTNLKKNIMTERNGNSMTEREFCPN